MSFAGGFAMEVTQKVLVTPTTNLASKTLTSGAFKEESTIKSMTFSPGVSTRDGTIFLPPLLSNNTLAKQFKDVMNKEPSPVRTSNQRNALPVANQSKIKQVIDELYHKEKRYVK
jgi:hypothetical protein